MNGYMRFFDNFFSFFKNIGISFYDSVIYDDRYKYILDGLFHTILIALFAVIIGIVGEPRGRVAFYMDTETMLKFASRILQEDTVSEFEAQAAVEETGNIIAGHGISRINDVIKDREMRLTPPGIISGVNIKLSNPDLIAFNIKAKTELGDIFMNVGFARSV